MSRIQVPVSTSRYNVQVLYLSRKVHLSELLDGRDQLLLNYWRTWEELFTKVSE